MQLKTIRSRTVSISMAYNHIGFAKQHCLQFTSECKIVIAISNVNWQVIPDCNGRVASTARRTDGSSSIHSFIFEIRIFLWHDYAFVIIGVIDDSVCFLVVQIAEAYVPQQHSHLYFHYLLHAALAGTHSSCSTARHIS